uniref:Peptidase S1 domain-containing protein n=1 Tax=Clytia hemisphaerica TaxID=252671 RepID=A0A7M5XCE2_9CNID
MNFLFVAPIICLILKITAAEQYFNDFKICGKSISKLGRIIGNEEAKPGDFPWQAVLRRRNSEMPYCGATLISNQWLITAAHCNVAVGHYVVLGANNLRQSYGGKRQYFRVKFIKSHPNYNKKYHDYDIVLIELDRPAIYTNYV